MSFFVYYFKYSYYVKGNVHEKEERSSAYCSSGVLVSFWL